VDVQVSETWCDTCYAMLCRAVFFTYFLFYTLLTFLSSFPFFFFHRSLNFSLFLLTIVAVYYLFSKFLFSFSFMINKIIIKIVHIAFFYFLKLELVKTTQHKALIEEQLLGL
jgi:hypothetical protein